jgi:hypothetical protein
MKKIFFFACLFTCSSSFAQVQVFPKKTKPYPDFLNKYTPSGTVELLSYPKATFKGYAATGKVYSLPQDNMPCLVPDISLIKPMPNAASNGIKYSLMPNPYKKEDVIPAQ